MIWGANYSVNGEVTYNHIAGPDHSGDVQAGDSLYVWAYKFVNPTVDPAEGQLTFYAHITTYDANLVVLDTGVAPITIEYRDPDTEAPTAVIDSPTEGSDVTTYLRHLVTASDNESVAYQEVFLDGQMLYNTFSAVIDVLSGMDHLPHLSWHTVTYVVVDPSGNANSYTRNVRVIDVKAPTTAITSPANNGTVRRNKTTVIQATASDTQSAIEKVEFYVNGVLKGTDTTAAYSYSWAVPSPNGVYYTLMIKTYDVAGNIGTHSIVVRSVN